MENSFSNYFKDQAFYPFFPFVQYYSPKVFNTLSIGNNLEDSTMHIPKTPEACTHVEPLQNERHITLEESHTGSQ